MPDINVSDVDFEDKYLTQSVDEKRDSPTKTEDVLDIMSDRRGRSTSPINRNNILR